MVLERVVPCQSLRYIRELAKAGQLQGRGDFGGSTTKGSRDWARPHRGRSGRCGTSSQRSKATEAVWALRRKKSSGADQPVGEAYHNLHAPELDGLEGRVTEVLHTGKPPVVLGSR